MSEVCYQMDVGWPYAIGSDTNTTRIMDVDIDETHIVGCGYSYGNLHPDDDAIASLLVTLPIELTLGADHKAFTVSPGS